jgi:cephalosporin-C deacetylase
VQFDLPEPALWEYRSDQLDPSDFDAFWDDTLAECGSSSTLLGVTPVEPRLATLDVYDLEFLGYEGQPVRAWLRVPAGTTSPLPAVVEYRGYGGGRGHAFDELLWASAGFAHFVMDTRGQGSHGSRGGTADPVGSGPQAAGFLTRGIDSRETYFYRRVFVDAVCAVDAARQLQMVDGRHVAVAGGSQGGGIALAVAGLRNDVTALFCRVPFLCDFPRASVITDEEPYAEIARYLGVHTDRVAEVHRTLSYFDGVNFAKRATTPAWFSTGLMDTTCPPSTVFAAHNNYAGLHEMSVWPYNGHEGGRTEDDVLALQAMRSLIDSAGHSDAMPA